MSMKYKNTPRPPKGYRNNHRCVVAQNKNTVALGKEYTEFEIQSDLFQILKTNIQEFYPFLQVRSEINLIGISGERVRPDIIIRWIDGPLIIAVEVKTANKGRSSAAMGQTRAYRSALGVRCILCYGRESFKTVLNVLAQAVRKEVLTKKAELSRAGVVIDIPKLPRKFSIVI